MNKIIKYLSVLFVFLGIVFFVYREVYIPKTTYETTHVQKGNMDIKVFGIGNVGAKNTYLITSLVSTKIISINTDEGKWVKKGDLLVTLDSVDLPYLIQEAKIGVQKAQSEVLASQKELQSLQAQKHLAQLTYNRYAKLKKQSFASQAEYDKSLADLKAIDAQIAATQARIESAKIEVQKAKKAVLALEEKLSRYTIYAPVDGYVIQKTAEVAQSVSPTQSILKIVSPEDVWVKAYIDERVSGDVAIDQQAQIKLRSKPEVSYKGYVKRIMAQSDPVTQEREVDVAFEKLPLPFYINEQAEVLIVTKKLTNVLKIPAKALQYREQKTGIWTVMDDKAHFVNVKVLGISDGMVAVEGLKEHQKVLMPSVKNKALKEGMKVRL